MCPQACTADWYRLARDIVHCDFIQECTSGREWRSLQHALVCFQVLPSSGNRSISLWDVPDRETLQTWLDEFLDVDCSNEVFEVYSCNDCRREPRYQQAETWICSHASLP